MARHEDLAALIGTIPDHPRPGIVFRDIGPLIRDGHGFRTTIERLADLVDADAIDLVAGIEARGFVFAAALAYRLERGLVMLRKRGKLPGVLAGIDYALEYGTDRLEMQADAARPGARVLLVDDLLATGGTALAATALLRQAGAVVSRALFIIALDGLDGEARLTGAGVRIEALMAFEA
mgnify:CR=1 FL=1